VSAHIKVLLQCFSGRGEECLRSSQDLYQQTKKKTSVEISAS